MEELDGGRLESGAYLFRRCEKSGLTGGWTSGGGELCENCVDLPPGQSNVF